MKKYRKEDFMISQNATSKAVKIAGDYYKYKKISKEKISAADYISYSSPDMSREKVNSSIIYDGTSGAVERAEKEWFRQQDAAYKVKVIDEAFKFAAEYARPDMRRKVEMILRKSMVDKIRREYLECSKEMLSKYRQIAVFYMARELELLDANDYAAAESL